MAANKTQNYRNPFFNLAQLFFPKHIKSVFDWCEYFFYTNPLINSCITKMSEYAITDLIYKDTSEEKKERWKYIFENVLKIRQHQISFNLEYYTFGNCLFSLNFPFKRFLVCPNCKERYDFDSIKFEWRNFEFAGGCKKCKQSVIYKIHDEDIRSIDKLNIVRWNPKQISIKYNHLTGDRMYQYEIDVDTKRDVTKGDRFILKTTPKDFIKAIKENKRVVLENKNLFHFQRYSLSGLNEAWGLPLVLPTLQEVYYLNILRSAQEGIAIDRLHPHDFIYPQINHQTDPYLNQADFVSNMTSEIAEHRKDPGRKTIAPTPLGKVTLGGDGKVLLLHQEIKLCQQEICGGMNVPLEFIFGGLTWSGSSVTLRMLENSFLVNRGFHIDFLDWLSIKVARFLDMPEEERVRLDMTKFRMADDVQQKQLALQLNQLQKISDTTILSENGFDRDKEIDLIKEETPKFMEAMDIVQKAQADTQNKLQVNAAKEQVKAQMAGQLQMLEELKENGEKLVQLAKVQTKNQLDTQHAQMEEQNQWAEDHPLEAQQMQEEQAAMTPEEQAAMGEEQAPAEGEPKEAESVNQNIINENISGITGERAAGQYAAKIKQMMPAERQATLARIRTQNPELYNMIIRKLTPNVGGLDEQGIIKGTEDRLYNRAGT